MFKQQTQYIHGSIYSETLNSTHICENSIKLKYAFQLKTKQKTYPKNRSKNKSNSNTYAYKFVVKCNKYVILNFSNL